MFITLNVGLSHKNFDTKSKNFENVAGDGNFGVVDGYFVAISNTFSQIY